MPTPGDMQDTPKDGYVRVPAARLAALEQLERELHELRLRIQHDEMARANAEFLQDQLLPEAETPLEVITAASRTDAWQTPRRPNTGNTSGRKTFPPPQTLDDLLPDAERDRDSADDILAAIEAMPSNSAKDTLLKVGVTPKRFVTDAERNTEREAVRPMQYGEIFGTVLEMITRDGAVVVHTRLLTPGNVQTIMQAIETGMTRKSACAMVGITGSTFARYKRMAEEEVPQEPFSSFMQLLEMAEARAEAILVGRWQKHTTDSWQASKALLEKRFRQEWGERQQVDLNLDQLMKMSPEQLLEILGPEAKAQIIDMEQE